MIAQRPGTCRGCRRGFEAGTPVFFDKTEGTYHWDCWESLPQPQWVIDQAQKMGYTQRTEFEESEQQWSF